MRIDKRDCGCFVEIDLIQGAILKRAEIHYCTKHAAAPELHKLTKLFLEWLSREYNPSPVAINSVLKRARDILVLIEKETKHES